MCILGFELDDVWDSNGCVYIFCRPGSEGEETFPSPLAPPLAPSLGPSQEFSHVGKHTHENAFLIGRPIFGMKNGYIFVLQVCMSP